MLLGLGQQVRRREFIGVLGGATVGWPAVLLSPPLAAEAQQVNKAPQVGFLAMGRHPAFPVFVQALNGLGWVEGRNVVLEPRFAEPGKAEQFDQLAADLVQQGVDVIVALIQPEIIAARRATTTIPIVMVVGVNPVGQGFASSLARPGGNVTGLAWDADPEFTAKNVEILRELLSAPQHIGGIIDPAFPSTVGWEAAQRGALQLGLDLHGVEVRKPDQMEKAFAELRAVRADAVLVFGGSTLFGSRDKIAQLSMNNRLPVMFLYREGAEAGGLLSYGPSLPDLWRRSAIYVDKILRGARAAELPIEQPTKFELVINLKTAKALGLTIPPLLLTRADEVIE
ncbi:putative ABC transport system substrate-binding protein [Bradyrhizobium sp. cir1]|uniref:ABC transporter substrate-binding protein n=1 Tax=Bradyrhizobium sp. cir1 TaxID=1445730 RepID=UPI001606DA68|nr:ABC transporter substrate-binding protein [Bradyrhizobium sp. cir1]MBB4373909.1 putative ABC transport system substrate-binding protein [Bradyrhizobium sp. cir1]